MADLTHKEEFDFHQRVQAMRCIDHSRIDTANELARHLHAAAGFEPRKSGHDFFTSHDHFESVAFQQACIALNFTLQ